MVEIGMIPVVSASGRFLAPCRPLKALRLLKAGKAEAFWGEGETFYLRLKFDPKSPIILPEGEGQVVHVKEDMDVFKLIPPKKVYIKELVEVAKSNDRCRESVKRENWDYMDALLMGKWVEVEAPNILAKLAPIIKTILKGLAEAAEATVKAFKHQRILCENLKVDDFYLREGVFDARKRGVQPPEGGCLTIKETAQPPAEPCEAEETHDVLSADHLVRAREFGRRTGTYFKLGRERAGRAAKALLEAAIVYLRRGGRIASSTLRQALKTVLEKIRYPKFAVSKTLERGLERACNLAGKVAGWVPQLLEWIKSEAYIFWLGLTYEKPPTI